MYGDVRMELGGSAGRVQHRHSNPTFEVSNVESLLTPSLRPLYATVLLWSLESWTVEVLGGLIDFKNTPQKAFET